jgi:glucokinase
MFLACFGNAAANLALVSLATGGLFIGGGIAPRLGEALENGTFLKAFTAKGRLSPVLKKIPVRLILNPRAAVLGAARVAMRMLEAYP